MIVNKAYELRGHGNPVFTMELSKKPGILFTGGNDKGLVEWSLKRKEFIKVLFQVTSSVYAIHCPDNAPLLFAGLRNGLVHVFNFDQQKITNTLKAHDKPVFDVKTIPLKNELLVASEDGFVSVWSLIQQNLLYKIKVSVDTVRCIAVSPDGKLVAFGCRDNEIKIYNAEDYTLKKTLFGHTMSVFALAFSNDGKFLISGSRDAQLKIWDTLTYREIINIPAHIFAVNCIAMHSKLPYFATASMDKSIKIWDSEDFKLCKTISREKGYESHSLSINKICWDGNQLISTGDDQQIVVWDVDFKA